MEKITKIVKNDSMSVMFSRMADDLNKLVTQDNIFQVINRDKKDKKTCWCCKKKATYGRQSKIVV